MQGYSIFEAQLFQNHLSQGIANVLRLVPRERGPPVAQRQLVVLLAVLKLHALAFQPSFELVELHRCRLAYV